MELEPNHQIHFSVVPRGVLSSLKYIKTVYSNPAEGRNVSMYALGQIGPYPKQREKFVQN